MPRTRHIRPGFFTNDTLGKLPPVVRLLFAGLWTIADREGRLEDRPVKIQAAVLPYDHVKVEKALADLAAAGFITRYTVADRRYIQICTWRKHQRPHPREDASVIPPEGSTQVHPEVVPEVNHEDAPGSGPGPSRTLSSRTSTRTSSSRTCPPYPPASEGDAPPNGAPVETTTGSTDDGACCLLGQLSDGRQHNDRCPVAAAVTT